MKKKGSGCIDEFSGRKETFLLLFILLLAIILRVYGLNHGLPWIRAGEEERIVPHALRFGTGDFNPHSFVYPTFFMYLLFFIYTIYFLVGRIVGIFCSTRDFAVLYFTNPASFYLIGRSISVLFSVITCLVIYSLGKKAFRKEVGLLGAFLFALTPLSVSQAHYATVDSAVTFFLLLSIYFGFSIIEKGDFKSYLLAGLSGGIATSTKYTALLVVPSLLLAHFLCFPSFSLRNLFNRKLLVLCLVLLLVFFLGTPYALIDSENFLATIRGHYLQSKVGWLGQEHIQNMRVHVLSNYLWRGMGPALEVFSLIALGYSLKKFTKPDLLVASFPIIYYGIMGGSRFSFERYWLPIIPMLSLLSSQLLFGVKDWFPVRFSGKVFALLLLALSFHLLYLVYEQDRYFSLRDSRIIAREWIEKNIPAGTRIAVDRFGPPLVGKEDLMPLSYRESRAVKAFSVTPMEDRTYWEENRKFKLSLNLPPPQVSYDLFRPWTIAEKSLQYYLTNKFSYLIASSGNYEPYLRSPYIYPEEASFYKNLDREATLVWKVDPNKAGLRGYVIKIYSLVE